MHKAACINCGASFESARPRGTVFQCSSKCRAEFNNRRAGRGAEIYDLMMALRYERETATESAIWSKACALLAHFRTEDERERNGRKSWQDHKAVTERKPFIYAGVASNAKAKARKAKESTKGEKA